MKTIEQNVQAKYNEIDEWERNWKPKSLAETTLNRDKIASFLAEKHGGFITVATLNHAIESLKNELQWLAVPPATPTPAPANQADLWTGLVLRGSAKDKLYQMGVPVSPHMSYSDRQEMEAANAQKRKDRQKLAATLVEGATLRKELKDAQSLMVWHSSGRLDHGSTSRERAKAVTAVSDKIRNWNRHVPPEHKIEV